MAQPYSLVARWRRAYWQHRGEQRLVTTFWPSSYRVGSEFRQNGLRYRITRYDLAPDQRVFEVWGKPIGEAAEPIQKQRPTLPLHIPYER